MSSKTLISYKEKEYTYKDTHRILCKIFIEELKEIYKKYAGKIANHYLSYLAQAIKGIEERNDTILQTFSDVIKNE
ncbi:MAG: hypothetical protein ACTSSG_14860 [Candidatus Heimdallarchaeaceae archaeon]